MANKKQEFCFICGKTKSEVDRLLKGQFGDEKDADGEARERADVARSFLDVGEMSEEIWERFVAGARVFPDGRIEVEWNFGDEME